jgi:hypothetical protein
MGREKAHCHIAGSQLKNTVTDTFKNKSKVVTDDDHAGPRRRSLAQMRGQMGHACCVKIIRRLIKQHQDRPVPAK